MSPELQYLWIQVQGHLARVRDDEKGVSAVEWVIITSLLAILALGIGVVISQKIRSKAGSITLD
jgi:Flp pilus assembly pilin Flp